MRIALLLGAVLVLVACKKEPQPRTGEQGSGSAAVEPVEGGRYAALPRAEFNRWAVRSNLPVYWIADADADGAIDPDEVATLLFYPTSGSARAEWTSGGKLTAEFAAAYDAIVRAAKAPPPDAATDEGKRQALVGQDLDQGRATLVHTDLSGLSADDQAFVRHMMRVGDLVDDLYELQNGSAALVEKLPADPASHSLFRRNRGPKCVGPATEKEPLCSAIPGAPKPIFDLYPAELQADDRFCDRLAARKDAKELLNSHFAVVRGTGDDLKAVPYRRRWGRSRRS